MSSPIYIALVHYPIINKKGDLVTTSVTNFDLHDLSRNAATYGIEGCFIITPSETQQKMVNYIQSYWQEGKGAEYNPDRKQAFFRLLVSKSLEETRLTIKKAHDKHAILVATSAKGGNKAVSFRELKEKLPKENQPYLILFGTGWGLASEVLDQVDYLLEPIKGLADYNHLPVRSAVAIVLDRLLADW
ncbi:MAG: protein of unknown function DUF2168 [uncultured bacterium]|nr:MAG: protein of unknown function DUF2168 [uncultured bacterium]